MSKSASPSALRPKARAPVDTLPELFTYEDTGCEVSASCLDCPLPRCKYDDPTWFHKYQQCSRDLNLLAVMQREELTVEETAERFAVTVRTVFRIIRRCRDGGMAERDGAAPALLAQWGQALAA